MVNYEIVISNKVSSHMTDLLLKYWKFEHENFINLEMALKDKDEMDLKMELACENSYVNLLFDQCSFCRLPFTKKVFSREEFLKEINYESKKCGDCTLNSKFFEDENITFKELSKELFSFDEIRLMNKVKRRRLINDLNSLAYKRSDDTEKPFFFSTSLI